MISRTKAAVAVVATVMLAALLVPTAVQAQVPMVDLTVGKVVLGTSPGGEWSFSLGCGADTPQLASLGDGEWDVIPDVTMGVECRFIELDRRGATEVEMLLVDGDGEIIAGSASTSGIAELEFTLPVDSTDPEYTLITWNSYQATDICAVTETIAEDLLVTLQEIIDGGELTPQVAEDLFTSMVALLLEGAPLVPEGPVAEAWVDTLVDFLVVNDILAAYGYDIGDVPLAEGLVIAERMVDVVGRLGTILPWLAEECGPGPTTTTTVAPTTTVPSNPVTPKFTG